MIEFDHVSKSFPTGNIILDDVSFVINPQDFVILTGISGAGKTTIARLIIKDLSPSEGIIKIDNQNLSSINNRHLPQLRRKIGLVFQDYKIIPDKTVYENVALALEIIHHPAKLIPERVTHLLELVGIADKSNLFPSQLSGGEQQRAAIARAVVGEPQILFADEPTG
ncbi:ATP-binding cassette domain-containing protein, partial [Candidatus Collierbacteria bacterium]|nr:ATP-binding cassette domain-containing protein [Candidatus Collierbacteria bacterium]